jgi:hypothetical protein
MPAKKRSITKALKSFTVLIPAGDSYLDIARELSKINRKLFSQGKVYGVESIEFGYNLDPALVDTVWLTAQVAGDSWPVHNGWVKGKALWNQMNDLVLEDNPSIQGKWADFKVLLDSAHLGNPYLNALDNQGNPYLAGEWGVSDYVIPEHSVDVATGEPLPALQTLAHLIGPDVGTIPLRTLSSVGLVQAYQESRATVNPDTPNVQPGMADSFFNLLTDSGSQEPELALVIEGENDNPPYDLLEYPGGAVNAPTVVQIEYAVASVGYPTAVLAPFVAQCGLIKFQLDAFKDGANAPGLLGAGVFARINLMAGTYKGVAAMDMGQ